MVKTGISDFCPAPFRLSSRRDVVGDGPRAVPFSSKNVLMSYDLDVIFCSGPAVFVFGRHRGVLLAAIQRFSPLLVVVGRHHGVLLAAIQRCCFCCCLLPLCCHRGVLLAAIQRFSPLPFAFSSASSADAFCLCFPISPVLLSCPSFNPVNPDSDSLCLCFPISPVLLSCPSFNPVNPDSDCLCLCFLLSYHYQRKNA